MEEISLHINYQTRYYKLGKINTETKQIWYVIHGYGQLAQYFISKFKILEKENICIIAPEGLSKFYLENIESRSRTGNNRVGASWMTKENRLVDISNYITYLNSIYELEASQHDSIPITLLGFSQGAATVTRWVLDNKVKYSKLILWSGIFPEDLNFDQAKELLSKKDIRFVYGSKDPFLTEDRLHEMKKLANQAGIIAKPIVFDGGHELDDTTLIRLIE